MESNTDFVPNIPSAGKIADANPVMLGLNMGAVPV